MIKTVEQRLLSRTTENKEVTSPHVTTPCWVCDYKLASGYPQIKVSGKTMFCHRVAYELWVGPTGDKCVCHACDEKRCINPDHQWLGIRADNNADRDKKGRHVAVTGVACPWVKLTEEQVREIRSYRDQGCRAIDIAKFMELNCKTVANVFYNRCWKHVL